MSRSVVDNITKMTRTRGESKYMLEEVYFSDICGDVNRNDEHGNPIPYDPQKAYYENGRYHFQYPALWYQSVCSKKAIGLRGITIIPDCVGFTFKPRIYKLSLEDGTVSNVVLCKRRLNFQYPPDYSIYTILSDICRRLQNWVDNNQYVQDALDGDTITFSYEYNRVNQTASIILTTVYKEDEEEAREAEYKYLFAFEQITNSPYDENNGYDCDFYECFNTTEAYITDPKSVQVFSDVWNRMRSDCFLHASFVNGTSFDYLGITGSFYPKPSKMYRFNGNSPDFYFTISLDGKKPINRRICRFIVELCYIFNDGDYMAE